MSPFFSLVPLVPLLIAGVLILWNHAHTVLTWPGLERLVISRLIEDHEESYLMRMRDTHLGCKTVQHRHPDIVFIGDSHSYAGYNYVYLQEKLRPARVGNCALSGLRPANVIDFLSAAKSAGLLPQQLVFGISPEMFWKDEDRRMGLTVRARREIAKIGSPKESVVSLASGEFRHIEDFRHSASMRAAHAAFEQAMAGIDADQVDRFLAGDTSGIHALDWWRDTVLHGALDRPQLFLIEEICRAARRNGIILGVVYVPESRWLLSRLSTEQRSEFLQVTKRFAACADWTDFSFFPEGAPNTWYVNRQLLADYPYSAWSDVASARKWIEQAELTRRWQFFDPDHMNALGASEFSYRIVGNIASRLHAAKPP